MSTVGPGEVAVHEPEGLGACVATRASSRNDKMENPPIPARGAGILGGAYDKRRDGLGRSISQLVDSHARSS